MHIEALRALRVGCRHNKSAICALFLAHKNSRNISVHLCFEVTSSNTSVPAGYSKEGLAISYGLTSFILKLTNATTSRLTFTQSKSYGTCPTSTQAQVIVGYWSLVNSALLKYGGASLGSNSYWTSTGRGNGNQGYYYSSGGVVFATKTTATNYVRCVAATL